MTSDPPVPDLALRTARDLVAVTSRTRRRLKELREEDGLTPSQTSVLSRLDKQGPATASALAVAERVRPQSMAATVAALQERGMVDRTADPSDGRRQVLSVSAEGRSWLAGARAVRDEWLVSAVRENLSEVEQQVVLDALALVERVIER